MWSLVYTNYSIVDNGVLIIGKSSSPTVKTFCIVIFYQVGYKLDAWEVMALTWNSRGHSMMQHLVVFSIIPDPEMGFQCNVTLWCGTFGDLLSVISWWVWLVSYTGQFGPEEIYSALQRQNTLSTYLDKAESRIWLSDICESNKKLIKACCFSCCICDWKWTIDKNWHLESWVSYSTQLNEAVVISSDWRQMI